MADVHPLALRAFDDEVQAQLDLARIREEIRSAEAQRDRIREEARREGLELGRREAAEQAARAERERVAAETEALGELLRKAAQEVRAKQGDLLAQVERELIRLAVAVAGRIVKAEVDRGRPVAVGNLRRAVELTSARQQLRILLHPRDLALVEGYLPDLRREFAEIRDIALEPSSQVDPGGVVVRTQTGSADATIAAQLDQIERGLLG